MQSLAKKRLLAALSMAVVMVLGCLLATDADAATKEVRDFIAKIRDENADVRYAAWRSAGKVGAPAVVPLGRLVAGEDKGVAKAASEALNTIAHYASRPGADGERKAVSKELMKLLGRKRPQAVRVKALELLGLTGDDECVLRIARLLGDEKLREDARRALERIPGKASVKVLIEVLGKVPEDFRPAIIHSLGQKNAVEALDTLAQCAESSNKEIALAAYQAISRIDGVPSRTPQPVVLWEELSDREKRVFVGAYLRFADRRAAKGDAEIAQGIYRGALASAEQQHLRCAGLIGLAKVGSASDVDAMLPALADESAAVRHVAEEALISLKDAAVDATLKEALETASGDMKECISKIISARQSQ